MSKIVAIVDPFSSGNLFAKEIIALGYSCISIFSGDIEDGFIGSYIPEDYIANFTFSGEYRLLLDKLKLFNLEAIIVGCESGVELSDQLAHDLNLPCNDIRLSPQRRNKYLMQERIAEKGLRQILQKNCFSVDEVLDFSKKIDWPVVIKPLKSAGTDNVYICKTEQELLIGSQTILESKNAFGEPNVSILAQEYIGGVEYAIDSVSLDGKHYVTNITEIIKEEVNSYLLYRQTNFIPTDSAGLQPSIRYVYKVLDALGITIGASHCEIKVDANGPVLIEVGARMQGGMVPKVVAAFAEHSQTDLCIDAFLRPDVFVQKVQKSNTYSKYAKAYGFVSKSEGVVAEISTDKVAELPSYHWGVYLMKLGEWLSKTTSFIDCPGWVFLLNEDSEQLQRDFDTLSKWEINGEIYKLN